MILVGWSVFFFLILCVGSFLFVVDLWSLVPVFVWDVPLVLVRMERVSFGVVGKFYPYTL